MPHVLTSPALPPPGQRSSSLHYAACFGRPAIAKVLLRCGANPDLRDEDSKTPLDKARERNDEGHREVSHGAGARAAASEGGLGCWGGQGRLDLPLVIFPIGCGGLCGS